MRGPASQLVTPSTALNAGARRAIDVLCAGFAASIFLPVFVIVALSIWLESGRPILYSQRRLGQSGQPFHIYKFRKFKPSCDPQGYPLTLHDDGRLTSVGRILAKTKLDELPQLWNVLRGDMSLVGPRPESFAFADCFRNGFEELLEHKPGVFGPCQVMFRHESELYPSNASAAADFYREVLFPAKAKIDLAYFSRRTLVSDFSWIFRAVGTIAADIWTLVTRCNRSDK